MAQAPLRVDEGGTHVEMRSGEILVGLAVENLSRYKLPVSVVLEWVDPTGATRSRGEQKETLSPGKSTVKVRLAQNEGKKKDIGDFLFYRLRYSIRPGTPEHNDVAAVSGIISAGAVTPNIFELHGATTTVVRAGGHYFIRVRAIHPVTGRGVAGVSVRAGIDFDRDDENPLMTKAAVTDSRGFARLEFRVPDKMDTDEIEVTIGGSKEEYSAEATQTLRLDPNSAVSLTTDKPIYQPGQQVHTRLMAFDANKNALANEAVTLKILDPEETLVYRAELRTSRFGIASADWQIPENLRGGDYRLEASFGEGRYENIRTLADVRISRYNLPTFTVEAKPDRAYYLPGQRASVEVRAGYLFGERVPRGRVRVVHESERRWNYREQKWEAQEEQISEGETDEKGLCVATLDLTKEFQKLLDNDYERYKDLDFAAYFTDLSTRRTEQRRFSVRITKDQIHVYVIEGSSPRVKGLPLELYLSADYADGAPAECDIAIYSDDTGGAKDDGRSASRQLLRHVRTNRYGIAKISDLRIPDNVKERERFDLHFVARDTKGAEGRHSESVWYWNESGGVRVQTDKALYKPGEPIVVDLATNLQDVTVIVEAVHDWHVLDSRLIRVKRGHASLTFADTATYENEVSIVAYAFGLKPGDEGYTSSVVGYRAVLFPKDHELKVGVKFGKTVYRPGEEATADLRVTGAAGERMSSAVGLVVVDKAVEERAKTDGDFGGRWTYEQPDGWNDMRQMGGVRRGDLDRLDLSKSVPDGMDLVAEVLLLNGGPFPTTFSSDSSSADLRKMFAWEIDRVVDPVRAALESRFKEKGEYPRNEQELTACLGEAGLRFAEMRDPWGMPYRAGFSVEREQHVMVLSSAGPDKTFGDEDDFVALKISREYFAPIERAMQKVAREYHERTGGFVRDAAVLKPELGRAGIDLDSLKDPWGHAYRFIFGVDRTRYTIHVASAGPDGRFATADSGGADSGTSDDFSLATIAVDYFGATSAQINNALAAYFKDTQIFPESADQLSKALGSNVNWDELRDAWGHRYYATFSQEARFSDDLALESYEDYLLRARFRVTTVPVTRRINWIHIRSTGADGKEGTEDDFDAAIFSRGVVEQDSREEHPVPVKNTAILTGATGAISGTVTDLSGAAIPGARVSAKGKLTEESVTADTDENGEYVLKNLAAGFYNLQFSALGFRTYTITGVPVRSSNVTKVDAKLNVGAVTETVEVQASVPVLQTQSSMVAAQSVGNVASLALTQLTATPRLREYFPETLLWRPEIVTDDKGLARLKFPLADNITTWKLAAVASTVHGEIGSAQKEFRAFQPFFVEHDPPRFLTVGDEIALPVVVRNYLGRTEQVGLQMKPAPWFSMVGPDALTTDVPSQGSASSVFRFRAAGIVKEGKQEVSAVARGVSDAIARAVSVRPNGEEKAQTIGGILDSASSFELTIPEAAIPESIESRLKIYPNLQAHVLESIEAILRRPYGCAEQTISSAYPSVLFLKYAKQAGVEEPALTKRAHRYAELGYERLLSYRNEDGGFSYWGRGAGDLALTAYAVRFLSDANEFVAVDNSVIAEAASWILRQAESDGHWSVRNGHGREETRQSVVLTSYIARVLSNKLVLREEAGNSQLEKMVATVVRHSLEYLQGHVDSADEPYAIASYALAANGAGDKASFEKSAARLPALERREGSTSYWSLETNTPFYGWGIAGRVETTALVLQTLAAAGRSGSGEIQNLISRGLLFLLRNQDRYGIWYSTQATINVLDAIGALTSSAKIDGMRARDTHQRAEILIDGKPALSVELPTGNIATGPVEVDLSKFVTRGTHRMEIRRAAAASRASVQVVSDYYVPWDLVPGEGDASAHWGSSSALRLAVHFDKNEAKIGETVQCEVDAERMGFRGYGMLLAEIGLPPGAEVDRESLEKAKNNSGWDLNEYDVQPDRLIVYLWPKAGGTKFSFSFKPRFALKALSGPSTLYDYYNPEAHAVVAPTLFKVQQQDPRLIADSK